MKENKVKFKKPLYIFRVLFIVLVIIGIYVLVNFTKIFTRRELTTYEITTGEIVNVDRNKGYIFRDEVVYNCKNDGYINFFVPSASRVGRGSFIYSISEKQSEITNFNFTDDDVKYIKQNIEKLHTEISDLSFYNIYSSKQKLDETIKTMNAMKLIENIDLEKELNAKEKGYSQVAGLVSFVIDGCENIPLEDFDINLLKNYNPIKYSSQKKEVKANDSIYKIIKNPEYNIVFDSKYDYDQNSNKNIKVKFGYDNITANGKISSFLGADGKKYFKISIVEFPEKFIDKRIVDFEIENRKISGYKIPVKSIVTKNCYTIPKTMIEYDVDTKENVFYKLALNGEEEKITCNISKEDDKYYYISIDDVLSKLKFGDVLINRYGDTYSLSEVEKLEGVYSLNKGYAIFKNVDIIDKTNEFAIIKKSTSNGIYLYDRIALNAGSINEGDFIS